MLLVVYMVMGGNTWLFISPIPFLSLSKHSGHARNSKAINKLIRQRKRETRSLYSFRKFEFPDFLSQFRLFRQHQTQFLKTLGRTGTRGQSSFMFRLTHFPITLRFYGNIRAGKVWCGFRLFSARLRSDRSRDSTSSHHFNVLWSWSVLSLGFVRVRFGRVSLGCLT